LARTTEVRKQQHYVTSWSDYVSKYGSWNGNNKLPIAVKLFFDNGGSACYVKRVAVGTTKKAASRKLNDGGATPVDIVKIEAANVGFWGNNVFVTVTNSAVTGRKDVRVSYLRCQHNC